MADNPVPSGSIKRNFALYQRLDELNIAILRLYGPDTKFQRQLAKLRKRSRLSSYGLATLADVDTSYLRRLITGEKRNPGRRVVARLGEALLGHSASVSTKDVDRLMRYAGYLPLKHWGKGR